MEILTSDFFIDMLKQAPTIGALMYLVYRQEKSIAACYDKILELFKPES